MPRRGKKRNRPIDDDYPKDLYLVLGVLAVAAIVVVAMLYCLFILLSGAG